MNYYLTSEDIIKINLWCQKIVSCNIDFTEGIRDYNLLESVPVAINQSFAGEELYPTIFDKCTYLWFSLSKFHCFADGNERTALVTLITYLSLNGYHLHIEKEDLYDTCMNIAGGNIETEQIKEYIQKNIDKIADLSSKNMRIETILNALGENSKFVSLLEKLGR